MASFKEKFETKDRFDIDRDLDIPDFNFDGPTTSDDRNPVTKVAAGVMDGIKGSVFNSNQIRNTIKTSLPKSYGEALDLADHAAGTVRSLYHSAADEIRPAVNDLKNVTRRILPKAEGILPKKIGEMLKDWSKEKDSGPDLSRERQRDDALQMELGSIFKAQAEDDDKKRDQDARRDQLNQGIEQIRHRSLLSVLSGINSGISHQISYQDKITANYQRKSLELQFRSYFVLADILETQRAAAEDTKTVLGNIQKNTGLPDFAKIHASESFHQIARNKFLNTVQDSLFGESNGYVKKLIDNIGKSVKSKIKDGIDSFSSITSMADMATSVSDGMGDEFGPDKYEMGGSLAGNIAGDYGMGKFQKWLGKKAQKYPGIVKLGENIRYGLDNSGGLINDHVNDYSTDWGMAEGLRDFIRENLPNLKPDTSFEVAGIGAMKDADFFNRATNRSIVEIIPGLLSRIHREIQVLRTGDTSIGLTTFDYNKGTFSDTKSIAKKITDDLGSEYNRKAVGENLDDILKMVDPEGKFSDREKADVRKKLMDISLRKGSSDSKALTDRYTWGDDSENITAAFSKLFEADADGKRSGTLNSIRNQRVFSEKVRKINERLGDPRADLQAMINLGQIDQVRATGLLDPDTNNLSLEAVRNLLLNGSIPTPSGMNESFVSPDGKLSRKKARQLQRQADQAAYERNREERQNQGQRGNFFGDLPEIQAKVDNTELISSVDSIKDFLVKSKEEKDEKGSSILETISDNVAKISDRLGSGIYVFGNAGNEWTGDVPDGLMGPGKPSFLDRLKSKFSRKPKEDGEEGGKKRAWWDLKNLTLGEITGSVTDLAGSTLKHASTVAGRVGDITRFGIRKSFQLGTGLASGALDTVGKFFGDVYVKGESKPRLTRVKMDAGEYFDQATGKVLTSLRKIKGTVVDKDGNVVLDESEIENAYTSGGKVQLLKNLLSGSFKIGTGIASNIAGGLGGIYRTGFQAAATAFKIGKSLLPPYDVYVKGSEDPILYASQMRLGKYYSQKTGKPIKHPRDIDGPVVDADGNFVVRDEDIETGLVDKNGIAVGNKIGRFLSKVGRIAKFGLGILQGAADKARGLIGDMTSIFKNVFTGIFGGIFGIRGEYLETTKSQLEVQTKIYDLLLERLPEKKKHVVGDIDGDGIRDGSVEDLLRKDKEKNADKETVSDKLKEDDKPGGIKALLGGLSGLFKKKKADDEEEEGGGSMLQDAANVADIYDAARGNRGAGEAAGKAAKGGKLGRLGRFGSKLKGGWNAAKGVLNSPMGKFGGRILGGAGLLYGGYSALKNLDQGNYGDAAIDAGLTVGGAAIASGGLSVTGALGALGAGAAAIIGSPVALAALGLGAAYLGYKYLTRKKLDNLSKVRYAQYGFNTTDEDHFKAIFEMEDKLEQYVKFSGTGENSTATIDQSKLKNEDLFDAFNVDKNNPRQVNNWLTWFEYRFKPVFLTHLAVLKTIKPDCKLASVDSGLEPAEKLKYLDGTNKISVGVYSVPTSPYPDLKVLPVDANGVSAAVQVARTVVEKEIKEKGTDKSKIATGATVAAAAGATSASVSGNTVTASAGGVSASVSDDGSADMTKLSAIAGSSVATISDAGIKISASSTVPSDFIFTGQSGRMDALTSIRYKAYGLVEMDLDKVRSLRALENFVASGLRFDKAGANFDSDVEAVLDRLKAYYGITGARSPRGYDWMVWFKSRFLPVFLNFATSVEKLTGNKDPIKGETALKPQDAISVANIIITTTAVYNSRNASIWNVSESPWRDYTLNLNKETTEANLQALTETAKAVVLGEHKSQKIQDDAKANSDKAKADRGTSDWSGAGSTVAPSERRSIDGKIDKIDRDKATKYGTNNQPGEIRADGVGVRAVGDFTGGAAVKHPGKGTGGDINQIPEASGAGWDSMKATIIAAAKMAGVDPKILATIAGIESSFDPNARPGINKATGQRASSATGLMQFIAGTWNSMLKKYGPKYGIDPATPPTDARASALLGAEYIKENMQYLQSKINRPITSTDVYLGHFLGAGGAASFLKNDPSTIGAAAMPKEASANTPIFYKSAGEARTFGEIYKLLTDKISRKMSQLNVPDSAFGDSAVEQKAPVGEVAQPMDNRPDVDDSNKPQKAKADPITGLGRLGVQKSDAGAADGSSPTPQAGYGASIKKVSDTQTPEAQPKSQPEKAADALAATAQSYQKTSAVSPSTPVRTGDVSTSAPVPAPVVVTDKNQSSPKPSPMRPVSDFNGYGSAMQPSPAQISAQDAAQRKQVSIDVTKLNEINQKQLDVQIEIRNILKDVVGKMSMKEKEKQGTAPTPPASTDNRPNPPQKPQRAPTPPVSMANRSFE